MNLIENEILYRNIKYKYQEYIRILANKDRVCKNWNTETRFSPFLSCVAFLDCRINFLDCSILRFASLWGDKKQLRAVPFAQIVQRRKLREKCSMITYIHEHIHTRIQIHYLTLESVYWLAMNIFTAFVIISDHCIALLDMRNLI